MRKGSGNGERYIFSHGDASHVSAIPMIRWEKPLPSHTVLLAELLAQGRLRSCERRSIELGVMGRLTDMLTRRTLLGAPKWAFRDLRRELERDVLILTMVSAWWCVGEMSWVTALELKVVVAKVENRRRSVCAQACLAKQ